MKILLSEILPEFEYFPESRKKIQLVLHHTVSAVGKYVDDWFKSDKGRSKVAVAYVIDKNGDIFKLFNPSYWAYHIGGDSTKMCNMKSIGIEIVNEGVLYKRDNGKFYWWVDKDYPEGRYEYKGKEVFELEEGDWRGYKYFANYTKEQIDALKELTEQILIDFPLIKRRVINNFNYDSNNSIFNGILMHCNLRKDKTDLSPAFNIEDFTEFVNEFSLLESARKIKPKDVEYIKHTPKKLAKSQSTTKEGLDV
jgi:N-acetyl-anhydromuramyl-L-alanine amidase AmpD